MTDPRQKAPRFDLYPGLDDELERVVAHTMGQNKAVGTAAVGGIAAAAEGSLRGHDPEHSQVLPDDIQEWVHQELGERGSEGALSIWRRYDQLMSVPTPGDTFSYGMERAATFTRFFEAKHAIAAGAGNTPGGENAGETMHLVMVPWQAFRDNLEDLEGWLRNMRGMQGEAIEADNFDNALLTSLRSDVPIYRGVPRRQAHANAGTVNIEMINAREYLDAQIHTDGPWGVMLAQTSSTAGLLKLMGKSTDTLTTSGKRHLQIEGHDVDGMGIFEWLALTLQVNPNDLSQNNTSMLLANRLSPSQAPQCFTLNHKIYVQSVLADIETNVRHPRLAVL